MKHLAVIPARGNSKRIPRKNIRNFHGKPMISWAIEKALNSLHFSTVIVSTDSQEIATIGNKFGAETPFIRPANISDDYESDEDIERLPNGNLPTFTNLDAKLAI